MLLAILDRQIEGSVTLPGTWQYSPSVASTLLTTIVGATVALTGFVVTVTFSFSLLRGVDSSHVHNLGVTVAGFLLVFSLLLFVFFLDWFTHRLRPVAVARPVARVGRKVITSAGRATQAVAARPANSDRDLVLVVRSQRPGSIQRSTSGAWLPGPPSTTVASKPTARWATSSPQTSVSSTPSAADSRLRPQAGGCVG